MTSKDQKSSIINCLVGKSTNFPNPILQKVLTQQTLSAMKEHANENPERMRSLFRSLRLGKEEVKDQGQNSDGSFLHDGYDSF
jgi:hypothetical protein